MALSEKDKVVEQLFAQLQKKKDEIAKTEKPNWLTNCSFSFNRSGSDRMNIQTVSDIDVLVDALASLVEKEKAYKEAAKTLGHSGTFKWNGFTVEEWTADFQTRVNKINITVKKKEFADLEARLDKLVSPEKREAMELEALSKLLA
jgi:hypothetical protein